MGFVSKLRARRRKRQSSIARVRANEVSHQDGQAIVSAVQPVVLDPDILAFGAVPRREHVFEKASASGQLNG
jgi:hypothetical protein